MPTRLTRAALGPALLATLLIVGAGGSSGVVLHGQPRALRSDRAADAQKASASTDIRSRLAALVAAIPREQRYGTVGAPQLQEELTQTPPFLLDVREPEEVERSGHLAGSRNIPLRALLTSLDRLPARDQPIVVYCSSGHRGAMAMAALRLLGYTDVRNLGFGLYAWRRANLPMVAGRPPAPRPVGVAPPIEDEALFSQLADYLAQLPPGFYAARADAVHQARVARRRLFLLDVRRPDQYAGSGRIAGAVNVPLEVLFERLDALPARDAPLVVYCASGHRSSVAVMGLRLLGYTAAFSIEGGTHVWGAAGLPLAGSGDGG